MRVFALLIVLAAAKDVQVAEDLSQSNCQGCYVRGGPCKKWDAAKKEFCVDCTLEKYQDECSEAGCIPEPAGRHTTCSKCDAGIWVPNSDPAVKKWYCVDCSVSVYHDACQKAGCPTPIPKYATCYTDSRLANCQVCGEGGKVCVGLKCLDCFAKENKQICEFSACGPWCGGGPRSNQCRPCSQDGKLVCAGKNCWDCAYPGDNEQALKDCEQARCRAPGPGSCIDKPSCSACQPGKVCVRDTCIDCNAQQNYNMCYAAGCG